MTTNNNKKTVRLLLASALIILTLITGCASTKTDSFTGEAFGYFCYRYTANPEHPEEYSANVRLTAKNMVTQKEYYAYTDKNGLFVFKNLPCNYPYRITYYEAYRFSGDSYPAYRGNAGNYFQVLGNVNDIGELLFTYDGKSKYRDDIVEFTGKSRELYKNKTGVIIPDEVFKAPDPDSEKAKKIRRQIFFTKSMQFYSPSFYNSMDKLINDKEMIKLSKKNPDEFLQIVIENIQRYSNDDFRRIILAHYFTAGYLTYDQKAYKSGYHKSPDYKTSLKNRKAVCEGYAYLFEKICKELNIPCISVQGLSKNNNGTNGMHAWNIVCYDGDWYPADCTWDSNKSYKTVNNRWIFPYPEDFIKTHYPYNPAHQLLTNPVSLDDFNKTR